MKAHTKQTQAEVTPAVALSLLEEGNARFVKNLKLNRNLLQQVNETKEGQWPFATILSCIDSRTSAELIFDQGLGDIFSIRIAGNILNDDILGSMEFACKLAGSKLVLVLGHSKCGAIVGACNSVEMGNLSGLLHKVHPAIAAETTITDNRTGSNAEFVQKVTSLNVLKTVEAIRERSEILRDMESAGEITIAGALYNIESGVVGFIKGEMHDQRVQSLEELRMN